MSELPTDFNFRDFLDKEEIPRMSLIDSLEFVDGDPNEFLRKGRSLGSIWQFYIPQSFPQFPFKKVTVFSGLAVAKEALKDSRLSLIDPAPLGGFLGKMSALLTEGNIHEAGKDEIIDWVKVLMKDERLAELKVMMAQSIDHAVRHGYDIASALRRTLVTWIVPVVINPNQKNNSDEAVESVLKWLEHADSLALFVPLLRAMEPWKGMGKTRKKLQTLFGYQNDPLAFDSALTTIDGLVDNPTAYAAGLLAAQYGGLPLGEDTPFKAPIDEKAKAYLRNYPLIPLILRRVLEDIEIGGYQFKKGEAVAFETALTGLDFGYGIHACPGKFLGEFVGKTAVEVFPEGYAIDHFFFERVRLTAGIRELYASRLEVIERAKENCKQWNLAA